MNNSQIFTDELLSEFEIILKQAQAFDGDEMYKKFHADEKSFAKDLVNNLRADFSGLSSEGEGDLVAEDLSSLDKFCEYLLENKINYQGSSIVSPYSEVNDENILKYAKKYNINIVGMNQYLQHLSANALNTKSNYLNKLINNIINQLKSFTGNKITVSKLTTQPEQTGQAGTQQAGSSFSNYLQTNPSAKSQLDQQSQSLHLPLEQGSSTINFDKILAFAKSTSLLSETTNEITKLIKGSSATYNVEGVRSANNELINQVKSWQTMFQGKTLSHSLTFNANASDAGIKFTREVSNALGKIDVAMVKEAAGLAYDIMNSLGEFCTILAKALEDAGYPYETIIEGIKNQSYLASTFAQIRNASIT